MRRLSAEHVIWAFEAGQPPAYRVGPGEVFVAETRDALDGLVREGMDAVPPIERPNPATGPIAVDGLEPGQVLAVDILHIEPLGKGFLTFGGRPRFFEQRGGLIVFHPQIRLPAWPMIGTIGVIPAAGEFNMKISGPHGGNMDVRDVAAGATLYLTAQVEGGLLVLGDVHSIQADGESCGQGIETAASVTLRVRVLPRGLSPDPYLVRDGVLTVIATAETLDEAAQRAVEEMARIVVDHSPLCYDETRMLLGQVGNVEVGQIVCPTKTTKVALPLAVVPWHAPLPL
jgi:amidase